MALRGIKVIEIAGLAPGPFCGMVLSDFGANVIRIERSGQPPLDVLTRGKRSATIDLKHEIGKGIFKKLCSDADVLIEPFRAGVMERLGLGPDKMMELNKRLIYARLTGYGQQGQYSQRAGHDINYLAISGVSSHFTTNKRPVAPCNTLADFAGGGMTCAMGILLALVERNRSGLGQVVDCSMVDGVRYLASYIWCTQKSPVIKDFIWPKPKQKEANLLDGGAHFYTFYETKDNRWMSVGSIEVQFYSRLLETLGLNEDEFPHLDADKWPELKKKLAKVFADKTQAEWIEIFKDRDACVEPVLETSDEDIYNDRYTLPAYDKHQNPLAAPKLSRTPSEPGHSDPNSTEQSQHTAEILLELGCTRDQIREWSNLGVIECGFGGNKL